MKLCPGIEKDNIAFALTINGESVSNGKTGMHTIDTALRLATYFGNSPSFWLGLQMDYDLDVAEDTLSSRIKKEVQNPAAA